MILEGIKEKVLDFLISVYNNLLTALAQSYELSGFLSYFEKHTGNIPHIFLRHDVDKLPANALRMAKLEAEMGIKATYYFRITPECFDKKTIQEIAGMGHEIGYHYENLSAVAGTKGFRKFRISNSKSQTSREIKFKIQNPKSQTNPNESNLNDQNKNTENKSQIPNPKQIQSTNDQNSKQLQKSNFDSRNPKRRILNDPEMVRLYELAIEDFKRNLEVFREIVPIRTICMHGSPLSRIDNRDLWKVYDYRDFGIIGEPYFDIDFSKVFYLTDTGRRWNGKDVSIRDQVEVKGKEWPVYRSSREIITAVEAGTFPSPAMITVHPQRWTDNPFAWTAELVSQRLKNMVKKALVKSRKL